VLPRAIYFVLFAGIASFFPFLVLYYQELGLSGKQIGGLTALLPLVTVVATPFWGAVADVSRRYKLLLLSLIAGCVVSVFLLSTTTFYALLLLYVALFAFCSGPVMPLIDSSVLSSLGERRQDYGKLRLWGTVGFGLMSPLAGWLTERYNLHLAFYLYIIFLTLTFALVIFFPIQRANVRKPLGTDLFEFRNRAWLMFLVTIFIGGIGLSVGGNYFLLHMKNLEIPQGYIGLALTFATLGELPFMMFGHRLLKRYPAKSLLLVALFALSLRLIGYSLAAAPWHFLAIQLLHGPTFALIWIAGISYADFLAPAHLKATGQSLFSSTLSGLGGTLGAFVGGFLYDAVGLVTTFRWAALTLVLAAILLFLMQRETHGSRQKQHEVVQSTRGTEKK
jgi:MFS transporter, PPP family, 3-phenylpropionic acid transporter